MHSLSGVSTSPVLYLLTGRHLGVAGLLSDGKGHTLYFCYYCAFAVDILRRFSLVLVVGERLAFPLSVTGHSPLSLLSFFDRHVNLHVHACTLILGFFLIT